ncbi:MAG: hypothetical protein QHH07_06160 [Sedimentisphaerales bacterium]|nr:hypothetical protein [Sedimentisphaerales bacterium]
MQLRGWQQELLLDYGLGITSEAQSRQAEELIRNNPQAAALYQVIQNALSPLGCVDPQPCPDELVDRTVARLVQAAGMERGADLRSRPVWFNSHVAQVAAIAAIVLFAVGVGIPAIAFAKNLCMRYRCQWQLARVYQGLAQYMSDFDGKMPSVVFAAGQPWWKVGYQGKENVSNTRSAWLLVRHGYVPIERFLCPGFIKRPGPGRINLSDYNDFPGREFIAYSYRLRSDGQDDAMAPAGLIAADMNPLGERLPRNVAGSLSLTVDQELLTANSINHNRLGQNVLSINGAVRFVRTRHVGINQDDIYSIEGMRQGIQLTGCEVPANPADAFLVP